MTRLGRRKRLPHNARWGRRFRLPTAFFTLAVITAAADWPQFRGPSASGVGSGSKPPIHWDAAKGTNVVWKAEIPGLAISSPIVWGDRVYVTTAISSDPTQKIRTGLYGDTDSNNDRSSHQWKVMALDKLTGKLLWQQTAHEGVPKTKRHPKSSQASPSPATNGSVVVAYFGSEGLYAYSSGGKLLWWKDLGIQNAGWFFDPDSEWGVGSSPVLYKNSVIVLCDRQKDSFIAAFDLKDGQANYGAPRGRSFPHGARRPWSRAKATPRWSPTVPRRFAATTRIPGKSCGRSVPIPR